MNSKGKNDSINWYIVFFIIIIGFFFSLSLWNFALIDRNLEFNSQRSFKLSENGNNFDILNFWQDEILRVNNTPLNIIYGDNSTLEYTNPYTQQDYIFLTQEIYFDSPNWVNATPTKLTLHGFLLYPEKIELSNPGCLCMHGLNDNAESAFKLAYPYLEKGFIVLCHSHPGHGKSEGAEPQPSNLYYEGEYNTSAHFYLTLCGAIQGLRVLENLTNVNNSQILVTGISYGGLNSMWLAGICGERISGVVPYISLGDIEKNLNYPSKLIFWILGKSPKQIPQSYIENQLRRFDPIYYLKSPKLPPIMWQIGTNDEFFHYSSIKGTYDAVQHSDKFLQIYPNEHHGFPDFENTTKFFIDYALYNYSIPPKLTIQEFSKTYGLIGNILKVQVDVESNITILSVKVYYKFIDIIGACWQKLELDNVQNYTWSKEINPWVINSKLDYYFTVELDGESNVWFSSNISSAGLMISNYTLPFLILIIFLTALLLGLIVWRRNNKLSQMLEDELVTRAKRYFKIEIFFLGITESFFYISLVFPWISYEIGGVNFTHIYFFNNFFTWKLFLGEIAPLSTTLFILGWVIYSNLSLLKPIFSGILKIFYPLFILLFFGVLSELTGISSNRSLLSNYGSIYPGIGLYLMLFSSLSTIIIGIFKRKYEIKQGIKKKKKYYLKNIFKYIIKRWKLRERN